ncbi:MAG: FKBP-type peptidyl-prolyl cis-trans isomerase [Planctomycetota bacterium]|jgi:FKBP-type peptidyl-prolyl cis-trans isomerase
MNLLPYLTVAALGLLALPNAICQDAGKKKQSGIPACEDMKKTSSGLEWGILKKGPGGEPPADADMAVVHYTGWLTDGTKFDSSRDRGETSKFGVTQVIKGWTEGLKLMSPGMRCKLIIPSDLAYGDAGRPGSIPPKATLVFDVELVEVIRMPKLRPADPDKQKVLGNGVKYEVVKPGTGAVIAEGSGIALRYAIWGAKGQLIDCTEKSGQTFGGTLESMQWPFIKDIVKSLKVGGIVRADVPNALVKQVQTDSVWELELLRVSEIPKFRLPSADKVVTTQSGLQYEAITQGEGDAPKATSAVKAFYTGWLTDGKIFDSSHARGEAIDFSLRQVIPGWTEGLQLMKPGAKFLFQIPPELAYRSQVKPGIPANSTLIFLVELVEVK